MWPIALRQALTAKMADPVQYETMASFIANSASASDQVVNSSRNYRDMPLIVLSAGDRLQAPPGAPPPPPLTEAQMARQAAREAVFDRGQAELAELSTNGVNLRVPGANHHIQLSQPQAVIDAVAEVVEKVRASGR